MAIVVMIALDILTIAFYAYFKGAAAVPSKVIRLCLTAALCWEIYKGILWARWVVVGLLGLALGGTVTTVVWMWKDMAANVDNLEKGLRVYGLIGTVFLGHLTAFLLLSIGPGVRQYFRLEAPPAL